MKIIVIDFISLKSAQENLELRTPLLHTDVAGGQHQTAFVDGRCCSDAHQRFAGPAWEDNDPGTGAAVAEHFA
jgi:hypothetical protein